MENQIVFLRSNRIILRPAQESDIPLFVRWMNDPETRQYIKRNMPLSEGEEKEWFVSLAKKSDANVHLVMCSVEGNKPIGVIGLHRINWQSRHATTGTVIGEKDYRDKGLGTEAKMLLLKFAFDTLNLHKVCSSAYATNGRSVHYSEKCGYKIEARLREQQFLDGKFVDMVLLAVFREDWLPLWEEFRAKNNL